MKEKHHYLRVMIIAGLVLGLSVPPGACDTDAVQEYFEQGMAAYQEQDYQRAIDRFRKVLIESPDFAPAYNGLGLAYRDSNGRSRDAISSFKKAVKLDPQYAEAYDNLCRTYYQFEEHRLAEDACLKALAIEPSRGSAQLTIGWVYLVGLSQPGKAIPYFEEVAKRVKNPAIYFGLGMSYALTGQHAQALESITELKSLGQDQMASQLENIIRAKEPPPSSDVEAMVTIPEKEPGTIVQSAPARPSAGPSASPSEDALPVTPGVTRIRLKGQLMMDGSETGGQKKQLNYGENPEDDQGAVDRVRDLQRQRTERIGSY